MPCPSRQTIFYFRRTCLFGNASRPRGGVRGGRLLSLERSESCTSLRFRTNERRVSLCSNLRRSVGVFLPRAEIFSALNKSSSKSSCSLESRRPSSVSLRLPLLQQENAFLPRAPVNFSRRAPPCRACKRRQRVPYSNSASYNTRRYPFRTLCAPPRAPPPAPRIYL